MANTSVPVKPSSPVGTEVISIASTNSWSETNNLSPPPDPKGPVETLPIFDESVAGYPDDLTPKDRGRVYILRLVNSLRSDGIPSCLVQNTALIYYGALRHNMEWPLCVPEDRLDDVAGKLDGDLQWERCSPSVMRAVGETNDLFPRFKVTGVVCFLVVLSSKSCYLPCTFETIECGQSGLPFPKLDTFAQCLLDTGNGVDLDDLIDGMNLSPEWGEQHLNLSGETDVAWAKWKNEKLVQLYGNQTYLWSENPKSVHKLWMDESSADRKRRGQGWKFNEAMETRFWRRGQKDPRQRHGWS